MDIRYQIHKNFLSTDFLEKLKSEILHEDFPWRRRDSMTPSHEDGMYFTYCFYNKMMASSQLYEPCIIPILKKLHAQAPIQIRANMFISSLFKVSGWHTDYPFNCKTAILYLNDCDGGTELRIDNKITFIKADANKMLIFDTLIPHRAITSKEPIRYVINFNYFISQKM